MAWDDIQDPVPPRGGRGGGGKGGGPGGGGKGPQFELPPIKIPQLTPTTIAAGIIILLVVWIVPSIFYTVAQDEEGVVTRFGEYVRSTPPGLQWKLPSPIEHVATPKVRRVRTTTVGFRKRTGGQEQDVPHESQMLTGDENLVDIDLVVQYHIISAENYLFNIRNQAQAVHDVAETALRGIIGNRPIDDAITDAKSEIQIQLKVAMQTILNKYESGIEILNTQLSDVSPPQPVDFAFKDVQSAKEDKDRLVNEAKGYRNSVIPEARGKAAQIIAAAEGYREEVINKAEGDAHRFLAQYKEYRKAPEVTRKRIYLETMEEIYPGMNKVIMSGNKSGVLPILPLNKNLADAFSSSSKK